MTINKLIELKVYHRKRAILATMGENRAHKQLIS